MIRSAHGGRDRWARRAACALLAGIFLGVALRAGAHPLHVSHADADFNRNTQRLEIAVRVFADDLLEALNADRKDRVDFEKTPAPDFDAVLRDYVVARFQVIDQAGALVALHWVGREFDRSPARDGEHRDEQRLWIYLEAPLPGGAEGAKLHHGLLHERFRTQSNSVRVRDGAREVTLTFTRRTEGQLVKFPR